MRGLTAVLAGLGCLAFLSACTLNSARPIEKPVSRTDDTQAVIVFGVGKGPDWPERTVGFQLDEYSVKERKITGDCFRYNRLVARAEPQSQQVQYFAFRAPPGDYVLSPFFGQHFREGPDLRFHAPAGAVTYFGDFILVGERLIERMETTAAADRFAAQLKLTATTTAKTTPIYGRGPIFICTP